MKRFIACVLLAIMACALAGCTYRASVVVRDGRFEADSTEIPIGIKHLLDRDLPYEIIYCEDGRIDVIVHFVPKEEQHG